MIKQAVAPILAATLALTMACKPEGSSGGRGGDPDPLVGVGSASMGNPTWIIQLRSRTIEEQPVDRPFDCVVTGFANGQVVTVTDAKTGRTQPYKFEVRDRTPANLLIANAGGVDVIEVFCTIRGKIGDSFRCRTLSAGGGQPALLPGIDFNIIESADPAPTTFCTINISARS